MSEENVETVRRAYEAFNRGDIDGTLAVLASDFEYTPSGAIPGVTETHRGPEGFKLFVGWLLDQFDDVRFEINEVIGHDDDQVVFRHTNRGRGKLSGAETSWDVWQVVRFRDGKAVHAHAFTTKEEALEAAGLRE
ncbi:MAG TPA: nuclear transport factor 2 family protein [Solirubrobacterales bacterium]